MLAKPQFDLNGYNPREQHAKTTTLAARFTVNDAPRISLFTEVVRWWTEDSKSDSASSELAADHPASFSSNYSPFFFVSKLSV